MPFNYDVPTRAEILEHAEGDIFKLDKWFDAIGLPVEARKDIYSDLESYNYTGEDEEE